MQFLQLFYSFIRRKDFRRIKGSQQSLAGTNNYYNRTYNYHFCQKISFGGCTTEGTPGVNTWDNVAPLAISNPQARTHTRRFTKGLDVESAVAQG